MNYNKLSKIIKSGGLALISLLFFQWILYFAIVDRNANRLPIRHWVTMNTFQENLPESKELTIVHKKTYETDSVEIVRDHFGFDFNITTQLLVLSILAVVLFMIFLKMGIYPPPFLIPLFIILTISIFYHNYLGHRLSNKVFVEAVLCEENCDSGDKNIEIKRCEEGKCNDYKIIPDKYKSKTEANVKELRIDREKFKKAFKVYPADHKTPITLTKEDPDENTSENNKYLRASSDSKNHFFAILIGIFFFLSAMIFAKCFSKIKNFSDCEFHFLLVGSIALCILLKSLSVIDTTSLVEVLKLLAIVFTVVGYEKISKNKVNLWLYIVIVAVIEIGMLAFFKSWGDMLILGFTVLLVLFITPLTFKLKKIFLVPIVLLFIVAIAFGSYFYMKIHEPDSRLLWRLSDTWDGTEHPQYLCEIALGNKKLQSFSEESSLVIQTAFGKLENNTLKFFSKKPSAEIRIKGDDKDVVVVNNCKNIENQDGKKQFKKCDSVYNVSKISYESGEVEFAADSPFYKHDCRQINTDPRVAIFAMLKDGFSGGGHEGFKENTFLLDNNYMYTDFVFCGLAAFFGIWLALLVAGCLFILLLNCNIQPKQCGNNYKHFLYSNIIVAMLGIQVIIHIGANLNVVPFTGVILPFLSRGMANTFVSFMALGFALGGLVSDDFIEKKPVKTAWSVFEKIRSVFKQKCEPKYEKLFGFINNKLSK